MSPHATETKVDGSLSGAGAGLSGFVLVGDVAGDGPPVELPEFLQERTFIANFEGVPAELAGRHPPAPKCGPHLVTEHVRLGETTVWTLANNHAADFGPAAILELRDYLSDRGDLAVGAGADIPDSRTPLILRTATGGTIGLLSVCERQFGGATSTMAGTAEVGPWIFASIRALREQADFVIVSIHRGPENSPWPSPNQQDLYRAFIDAGANLVHGHHPHVPQGFEQYGGGSIFYGLGNFLVNAEKWASRHMSFVSVAILLDEDHSLPERFRVSHAILEQQNGREDRTIVADDGAYASYFDAACEPLAERHVLESCYQEVAVRLFRDHLYGYTQSYHLPTGTVRRRVRTTLAMLVHLIAPSLTVSDRRLDLLHHALSCPTHAEAVETATAVLSGRSTDRRNDTSRALCDRWAKAIPQP